MYITNTLVYTENQSFRPLTIRTDGDVITALLDSDEPLEQGEAVIDGTGCYCIPGLTDIHFHGCDGYDFCDDSLEACEAIASFELTQGVTSICPATMTLPSDTLDNICKTAALFHKKQTEGSLTTTGADLIGIHMEGPFINKNKKGAQNETYIQTPNSALIRHWCVSSEGLVKLVSLAPELPGALSCIRECKDEVAFSIAHTQADFHTAKLALAAGANHITHLYNAMPPFHHRDSGVIGAAYDTENCYTELICDGVHISAPVVRTTFEVCQNRVILISDSMRATGKPDGSYTLGGLDVTVTGNHAILSDGTLAGSVTTLTDCMKTAVSMGIPLETAVAAATINPCRSIGMDSLYGSISLGKKAHLVLLQQDTLALKKVIKGSIIL